MSDYNNLTEGMKTLARGGKLIYKDVVKPFARGGRRIGRMAARKLNEKKKRKSVWGDENY